MAYLPAKIRLTRRWWELYVKADSLLDDFNSVYKYPLWLVIHESRPVLLRDCITVTILLGNVRVISNRKPFAKRFSATSQQPLGVGWCVCVCFVGGGGGCVVCVCVCVGGGGGVLKIHKFYYTLYVDLYFMHIYITFTWKIQYEYRNSIYIYIYHNTSLISHKTNCHFFRTVTSHPLECYYVTSWVVRYRLIVGFYKGADNVVCSWAVLMRSIW